MRKPPTGEPYAGEPPVRFGGRGGASLPDPYQAAYNSNWGTTSDTDVDAYMIHIPVSAIP